MSKLRSVSRPVLSGTISVDASYAQELVEFWTQKYERVKEELNQVKDASVTASPSPQASSHDEDDEERESGPSSATEYEEDSETDALRASNEALKKELAESEKQCSELSQQIKAFLAQNKALAREADVSRRQMINSMYPPTRFFPAGSHQLTFRGASAQTLSERFLAGMLGNQRICFLPRPPACLPIRIPACGQHGYWFSPVTTYPEGVDFELVAEGNATEWTYLGRYMSIYLPGGEMKLSEWLALDDESKDLHCARVAAQVATPATAPAAAIELRQKYETVQAAVPCYTLVCVGFTEQMREASRGGVTRTRKRDSDGQVGSKRLKREAN